MRWRVEVSEVGLADPAADARELVETVRRHMLEQGWDLAVGLTQLPLKAGRRPVSAQASATHGVGLVSVPALGAIDLERRLTDAVAGLVEGLLGEAVGDREGGGRGGRERRMQERLSELASPLGQSAGTARCGS